MRTNKFTIGKVDNPSYKYDKYTVAVYQLETTYTVEPGSGLLNTMQTNGVYFSSLRKTSHTYKDRQLYFTFTPGSHLSKPNE
ncbi:hypothetical protein D3C79_1048940 [compost metagenome]